MARKPSGKARRGNAGKTGPKLIPVDVKDLEYEVARLSTDMGLRCELVVNMHRLLGDEVTRDQVGAIAEYRQHLKLLSDMRKDHDLEQRVKDLEERLARDSELAAQRRGSALRADVAPAPRNGRGREKN